MRIAALLMGVFFLFCATLQYNDPDPIRWLLVYLAASAQSFEVVSRVPEWWRPALLGAVTFAWALLILAGLEPWVVWRIFDQFEMASLQIEEAGETLGLLIISVWMLGVTRWARSHEHRNTQDPPGR
jgi:Transmembrane family 220, helix